MALVFKKNTNKQHKKQPPPQQKKTPKNYHDLNIYFELQLNFLTLDFFF